MVLLRERGVCLTVGEEAPDFELKDQNGEKIKLSDFQGEKNVLLVFHPGKVTELCKDYFEFFREHVEELEELDTIVVGVNMDSVEENKKWMDEVGDLGFPILSDFNPPGDVTLTYDCFVTDEGYGKRVVFLIDKKGYIEMIDLVKPDKGACPNLSRFTERLNALES